MLQTRLASAFLLFSSQTIKPLEDLVSRNLENFKENYSSLYSGKYLIPVMSCFLSDNNFVEKNAQFLQSIIDAKRDYIFSNNKLHLLSSLNDYYVHKNPELYFPFITTITEKLFKEFKESHSFVFRIFLRISKFKYFSKSLYVEMCNVNDFYFQFFF